MSHYQQCGFLAASIAVPYVLARVHGMTGVQIGLVLLPMAVVVALVAPKAGRAASAVGTPLTAAISLASIAASVLGLSFVIMSALRS